MISSHICDATCVEKIKLRNPIQTRCFGCEQNFYIKCFDKTLTLTKSALSPSSNFIFVCGKCHQFLSKHKPSSKTRDSLSRNSLNSTNADNSTSNNTVTLASSSQQSTQSLNLTELRNSTEKNTELLRTILSHITQLPASQSNHQEGESGNIGSIISTSLNTVSTSLNELKSNLASVVSDTITNHMQRINTTGSSSSRINANEVREVLPGLNSPTITSRGNETCNVFDIYRKFEKLNWESIDIINKKIDNLMKIDTNSNSDILKFIDSSVSDLQQKLNSVVSSIAELNSNMLSIQVTPSENDQSNLHISNLNSTQQLRDRFMKLVTSGNDSYSDDQYNTDCISIVNESSEVSSDSMLNHPVIEELLNVIPTTNINERLADSTNASSKPFTGNSDTVESVAATLKMMNPPVLPNTRPPIDNCKTPKNKNNPPTPNRESIVELEAATFKEKKWFYVSNLKPGTSESMVKSYICTKMKMEPTELIVKSLLKKNHDPKCITFTSFKVGVDETSDTTAISNIWPENVTVSVFIQKNEYPRRHR